MCGKCPDAARLHHQFAEKMSIRSYAGFGQCRLSCVHAVLGGLRLSDPGITTEPRGLAGTQSRPADLFTAAAVPGRSTGSGRVCGIFQCSSSPMRCTAICFCFQNFTSQERKSPTSARHRLSCLGLDNRQSTTPSSHPNATARSRHRIVPQRSANVSKNPPAKMETRNSNSLPPTKSSHDMSSPT